MTVTREKIIDLSYKMVQESGVKGMSYGKIAKRIGVSSAAIHYHFERKEDLLKGLLDHCHDHYNSNYVEIEAMNIPAIDKLQRILDIVIKTSEAGKICLMGVLSSDRPALDSSTAARLHHEIEHTLVVFARIFDQAFTEGLTVDLSSHDLARSFYSILIGSQLSSRGIDDIDMVTQAVRSFLLPLGLWR